jgi:hypothetical protein
MVRVHCPLFVFNQDFLRVELQKVSSDGEWAPNKEIHDGNPSKETTVVGE